MTYGYNHQCVLCGQRDVRCSEELFKVLKNTLLEKGYTFEELDSEDENGRLTCPAICYFCLRKLIKNASEQPKGIFEWWSDNFDCDE